MALLITYALLALVFSFICSLVEASFLSYSPTSIKIKEGEGKQWATDIKNLKQDVDRPLTALLTVNTIAHTVGSIMVGVEAEKIFGGGTAVGVVSAVMTLAILIISEIIPKTIGATYYQSLGNFTSKTLQIFIFPMKYTGLLWLLLLTTRTIRKSAKPASITREEFIAMTSTAQEEGVFEQSESSIIQNLLLFRSVLAKDVMTPFSVVIIEDETMSVEAFHDKHPDLKFSRIPLYRDRTNNITGLVLKDDVLEALIDEDGSQTLASLRREVQLVNAETPIPELFNELLAKRNHLAIVVDDYGNILGIVTMEDIIETLLGIEIMDEGDMVEDMQILARKNWEKRARRMGILAREKIRKQRNEDQSDQEPPQDQG